MPQIAVNLKDVEDSFENLPVGSYLGEVSKAKLREATEEGKFDQLMVTLTVLDEGELLGKVSTQWLSFSPRAAFMMKRFFALFGLGDLEDMDFDDDSLELLEPDITGAQVIFTVTADKKAPGGFRTEVQSVEEYEDAPAAAPAPRRAAPKAAAKAAEPEDDGDDDADDTDEPEAPAPRKVRRPAAEDKKPARRSLR